MIEYQVLIIFIKFQQTKFKFKILTSHFKNVKSQLAQYGLDSEHKHIQPETTRVNSKT